MNKGIYTILLLLCISTGFSQKLIIEGKIDTKEELKIYISHLDKVDSTTTQTGAFKFSLNIPSPVLIKVVAVVANNMRKNASRSFFAGSGVIHIEAKSLEDYRNVPIASSDTISEKMYRSFKARFDPLVKVARTYINWSYDSGRTQPEKKLLGDLYDNINQIEREVAEKFVYEHTNDVVGTFVFHNYLQEEKNANKLDSIYNLFNPNLHTSAYLMEMRKKIDHMEKLVIGKPAPLFSSITSTNQSFHLSQLRGKYVVLDFWGSWCVPCIKGIPKMKAYYAKYKKAVEFVGIACNDENTPWENAIKNNGLTWTQLFNNKTNQDLSLLYSVLAFPTKVIIGKKGELLGIFRGENEAFYNTLDNLAKD